MSEQLNTRRSDAVRALDVQPSSRCPAPTLPREARETRIDLGRRTASLILIAIFVLAAALRLGWLAVNSHSVDYPGIAASNGDVARNILVHNKWFVINDAVHQPATRTLVDPADMNYRAADAHPHYRQAILEPPGLPVVLAGVWAVAGSERFVYLQALQLLIDSAMVFVIYYLTYKLFHRRLTAVLAAALYAVYLPAILLARIPIGDAWAGWFTIGAVALVLKWRDTQERARWLVLLGVLLGVGVYFRPNVALLPVGFGLALLPWSGWRSSCRLIVIPLVVVGLALTPWTIRNYEVFHAFVPVRTSVGWTLWGGLGEVKNNFGDTGKDADTIETVLRTHPHYAIGSPRFDKVLFNKSLNVIESHPVYYMKLVGRRILEATVVPTPSGPSSGAKRIVVWAGPLLFLVAMLSTVLLWRRRPALRWGLALLLATAVTTIVPYVILHIEARYLVATAFVYLVLAAGGITLLFDRIAQRSALRQSTGRSQLDALGASKA